MKHHSNTDLKVSKLSTQPSFSYVPHCQKPSCLSQDFKKIHCIKYSSFTDIKPVDVILSNFSHTASTMVGGCCLALESLKEQLEILSGIDTIQLKHLIEGPISLSLERLQVPYLDNLILQKNIPGTTDLTKPLGFHFRHLCCISGSQIIQILFYSLI